MSTHEPSNLPVLDNQSRRAISDAYFPPARAPEPEQEDSNLRDVLNSLKRRKWTLATFTVAGVVAAFVWSARLEPRYTARAVVRLEDTERVITGGLDAGLPSLTGSNLSQLQALHSNEVLGAAVDAGGLRLVPLTKGFRMSVFDSVAVSAQGGDTVFLEFGPRTLRVRLAGETVETSYGTAAELAGLRLLLSRQPEVPEAQLLLRSRQRSIDALARALRATPRPSTDVVDIQYTSTDPVLAQRVVNVAVQAFRDRNISTARQSAERRRIFLEEQLGEADSLLLAAQGNLSEFRSRESVFSLQTQLIAQQTNLQALTNERANLQASRNMFRSMMRELENAPPSEAGRRLESLVASPDIAANTVVGALFSQLLTLASDRAALVSGPGGLSARNPDVIRLDEQIASTMTRLENAVASHLVSLDARAQALDRQISDASSTIGQLPEVEAEEARLVQQLRSVEGTVDQLREEYQRARITEAVEAGRVEVIDFATVPLDREGSGRPLRLALGLVLGLMLGSGVAFLAESLNTKIRRREEMEALLQVPSLGVVPRLPGGVRALKLAKVREMMGGSRRVALAGEELITISDARSPHAEAYRTMRTNLLFSDAIQGLKTVVVTSPTPGEGKSTTASNLAVAYAQQGMKTLLVDCDLRKARQHRIFGLPREPGLTDLVLGEASWKDVVHDYGPVELLKVLTSGTLPHNPSELLGGARMRKALDLFAEAFDIVILDTPPLIAGPDAAILGSACSGILVVVRAGQTEREAAQQAIRQLHAVGARVLGAVLNDPDGQLPRYSSYYAYQYKYYASDD